jgi:hypothetical protein
MSRLGSAGVVVVVALLASGCRPGAAGAKIGVVAVPEGARLHSQYLQAPCRGSEYFLYEVFESSTGWTLIERSATTGTTITNTWQDAEGLHFYWAVRGNQGAPMNGVQSQASANQSGEFVFPPNPSQLPFKRRYAWFNRGFAAFKGSGLSRPPRKFDDSVICPLTPVRCAGAPCTIDSARVALGT